MTIHVPAFQLRLSELVDDYDRKLAAIPDAIKIFEAAGATLKAAATINGEFWGTIDTGRVGERELKSLLLTSAWRYVYKGLNIARLASPKDKSRFEQSMADPVPFTLDNIRETFGRYILDPRGNILRGLAEVFCDLDQAYKSHDKVKIGVAGLPKRVILSGFANFSSYGRDRVETILNALAAYQGKPLVTYDELRALLDNETALLEDGELPPDRIGGQPRKIVARGVRLRRFANGNGHLFFEPDTLKDINKALAEYYGDVLPDTTDEKPTQKKASTEVSKDLQFYPTPNKVRDDVVEEAYVRPGDLVLEPSCGDGRLMDAIREKGGIPFGVEVDAGRALMAQTKGHKVMIANFLQTVPNKRFDKVIMNPPFYGRHYAKHVRHAFEFLKPGGKLVAILPTTARYDHGELDDLIGKRDRWEMNRTWRDLPVGSFSESGTNINTSVLTLYAPKD